MSWSVNYLGKPEKVVAALRAHREQISGQCQAEFDAALPHLIALVEQNFTAPGEPYTPPLVRLVASGSGMAKEGVALYRNCSVEVRPEYCLLL